MTSVGLCPNPIIYPNYCHYLSPTIGKWCPLWATDVRDLQAVGIFNDGVGGQILHLGNHPVKWVRLTGVIVAIDTWERSKAIKKIYTLDDSSGACIACSAVMPFQESTLKLGKDARKLVSTAELSQQDNEKGRFEPSVSTPSGPWEDLQVGTIVKIKGKAVKWWQEIRVEIVKAEVLRCTDLEVKCWNEVLKFRRDTLAKPWHLTLEEQRQCRRYKEKRKALKQKRGFLHKKKT